jgi:hypothetical protein
MLLKPWLEPRLWAFSSSGPGQAGLKWAVLGLALSLALLGLSKYNYDIKFEAIF